MSQRLYVNGKANPVETGQPQGNRVLIARCLMLHKSHQFSEANFLTDSRREKRSVSVKQIHERRATMKMEKISSPEREAK